jgi:hypothetical protein
VNYDTTYYWSITEVNEAETPAAYAGSVWSFTTPAYGIVDDFESYNDIDPPDLESYTIWDGWLDGFEISENGALVGYDPAQQNSYTEQTIVHSGNQSMPFEYNNGVGKSEATLTLTDRRDWTEKGLETLAIWYIGDAANAAETMYVVLNLNVSAGVDNDNPNAAQAADWTEWKIDLQAFANKGVNLANVNSITLGLGNRANPTAGGSGMLFFDDIRLYPPTP